MSYALECVGLVTSWCKPHHIAGRLSFHNPYLFLAQSIHRPRVGYHLLRGHLIDQAINGPVHRLNLARESILSGRVVFLSLSAMQMPMM